MIRWLVEKSLKFKFLVAFFAVVVVFFGVIQLRNVPVDVFPEFAPPMIEIQTEGPGMSATEIESLVTVQLEEGLNNMPGLDMIRSKTVEGLSSIRLWFDRDSDPIAIRQLTKERLMTVKPNLLPPADTPMILPPFSSTSRVMKIGISSDKYSLEDLSMTAYWKIALRLKQVPGVADVYIWGERWKMLTVEADPNLMRYYNVSLDELMEATSETLDFGLLQYSYGAKTRPEGFIDTSNRRFYVQNHISPGVTPKQLSKISIYNKTKKDGSPLLLDDVANVVWTHQPLIGDAVIDDDIGLLLVVSKFPWGNTLEVTNGVEKALKEMEPGLQGIEIDSTIFRPATFIEMSIDNLTKALIIGSILVFLAILFFLFEWRVALISSVIIPISMISALLILSMQDMTINVMVLTGLIIAIGAVVDDAIVDVENTVRRSRQLSKSESNKSIKTIVRDASLEVRNVIIFASLIEIIVLLPIFFMGGLSGAFFKPLASVYILAALVSPFVAMTVTPALVYILLSNVSVKEKEAPFLPWLRRIYGNILSIFIKMKGYIHIAIIVLVFAAGLVMFSFLGKELLPAFKEHDFLMHWLGKPGTSRQEMVRTSKEVGKELLDIPGVRNFGMHTGRAVAADEIVGMYFAENWVSIDPTVDYDKTLNSIQETVSGYPGLVRDVQTYLKERIREVLVGSSHAIVIRIYGPELEGLRDEAKKLKEKLKKVEGLSGLRTSLQTEIPQIQIELDIKEARKYGLKPGDARRAATTLIKGTEVSDIHDNDKVYEVMVWSAPEIRNSPDDIKNLLINTPNGDHVRLSDVADVRIVPTPNVISRENNSRYIDVETNIDERDLGSVVSDIQDIVEKVEFPLGYHVKLLGEYKELQESQRDILIVSFFAIIGVFLLLYATFNSWRLATLSFITIPTALSGGVFAAYFASGGVLSLGSLVGFLTILGVSARNGIMLIGHFQYLEDEEGEPFGLALILRGAKERLTPILMTTFTTGVALIPLVIAGNIPGHEIEHPMAIVILGGLITSTVINIFIVPALCFWFGESKSENKLE